MCSTEMPFPGATGKGLKIAVIDSGINTNHPHIVAKTSGVLVGEDSGRSVTWDDVLGHGTAVAAAIQEKAPGAEYFAVKLFDKALTTTSSRLIRAIDWTIDSGMDLVNLSLGTSALGAKSVFEALIKRAERLGVIMVCARYENRNPVLPGILDGVVSVDVDWRLDRHSYRVSQVEGETYYTASGFPRPLPGVSPVRNLQGISFAVANMTGLLARACEHMGSRSMQDVHRTLASGAFTA
jgi:subtilisin family serine protease